MSPERISILKLERILSIPSEGDEAIFLDQPTIPANSSPFPLQGNSRPNSHPQGWNPKKCLEYSYPYIRVVFEAEIVLRKILLEKW